MSERHRGEPLDPEPTLFGTARIDPHVYPDGSTEYSKALIWRIRRDNRAAFGARLRAALTGDPVVAANIRANTQPLRDYANDMHQFDPSHGDDEQKPETGWDPNN
jgi:hypothetical protein